MSPRSNRAEVPEIEPREVIAEVEIPLANRGEMHWQFIQRDAFVKIQNITRELIEKHPFRDLTITVTAK